MATHDTEHGAKFIEASEFQSNSLAIMEEAAECGEPLIITKNGKLLVMLKPFSPQMQAFFGHMKGLVEIPYDLDKPIYEQWLAEKDEQKRALMYLLDTNALLWLSTSDRRLGPLSIDLINHYLPLGQMAVPSISYGEAGLSIKSGRGSFPEDILQWRSEHLKLGLVEIPLDGETAARSTFLTNMNDDPADRVIIATALNGHTLITSDRDILNWPGQMDRLDARR